MRKLVPLIAFLLAASAFAGERYLVFEVDREDRVKLLHAQAIDGTNRTDRTNGTEALPIGPIGPIRPIEPTSNEIEVSTATFRTTVKVDRYLRAEFPAADGTTIDGRWLELERVPFVVRVPDDGHAVQVRTNRTSAQFVIDGLPRPTRAHAAADPTAANRVDLLILGDGYTLAEQPRFNADAQRVASQFFAIPPYSTYRNFVNVKTHFVPSAQSGADHPNCPDGVDPKEGTLVDTAFDASYCTAGIQRLIDVNRGKVYAAAAAVPEWDLILIIVNDDLYGGAGGAISVTSRNDAAVGIAQHEYGHSFTGLADEYTSPYPGFPPCSDRNGVPCEPNVTDELSRAFIKWAPWIHDSTVVPTIVDATPPLVGLFEGARYQDKGYFRPKSSCLMNSLGVPFCEVCAQAYVLRLYSGWNGEPRGGIDVIEPGSESPAAGTIATRAHETLVFRARLLQPALGQLTVEWLIDGVPTTANSIRPGLSVQATDESETVFAYTPTAGTHTVELRVTDPTPIVHPKMRADSLSRSRTWTVEAASAPAGPRRRAVGGAR